MRSTHTNRRRQSGRQHAHDASKSWNVPACKQADNVKQLYRSARHGGLQKLVVERSIVLGMPAEQAHARGKGAHMRRERVGQRGAARQKQREHTAGWNPDKAAGCLSGLTKLGSLINCSQNPSPDLQKILSD